MAAPMDLIWNETISWTYILKCSCLVYLSVCSLIYFCIIFDVIPPHLYREKHLSGTRVIILTSHPDDECMFFSPAVISLGKENEVFVLCTTTGDYYKKGDVRKKELLESCKILGVPDHNVQILDNSAFPDDPHAKWDLIALRDEVGRIIDRFKPTHIFTFDDYGVSGHPNHISVSKLSRELAASKTSSHSHVKFYHLESVSLLRKYVSFLDLPLSLGKGLLTFVSPIAEIHRAQRAMCAHESQMVWFRVLYIVFSRYMVINTFVEVTV